jgi:hypothetical protein
MNQLRFILADRFGFDWESIKCMPANIVQKYLKDIQKSKSHFKGINGTSVRRFASDKMAAGLPVSE